MRLLHRLFGLFRPAPRWRAVLDTNIFVAAMIDRSNAAGHILEFWEAGRLELVLSPGTFREMELVLNNHGLLRQDQVKEEIAALKENLRRRAVWVENTALNRPVAAHSADDKFLATAIAGGVKFLVSNDKHLRRIRHYHGVRIYSAERFLRRWREERE